MKVRTAVIPAAGFGTRFLPASKAVPKPMATLVDRPAIQWVVEEAVRAGIEKVIIVTGRGQTSLEDHFDLAPELEASLERGGKTTILDRVRAIADLAEFVFVRQGSPMGLGHAVGCGARAAAGEAFAVLLPDDILPTSSTLLADMVARAELSGRSVLALLRIEGAAISTKGVAALGADAASGVVTVTDVVEKPAFADAPSDLALIGRYVFQPELFDALDRIEPGALGELQLSDAIRLLCEADGGTTVEGIRYEGDYLDVGNHLDYLDATVRLALDHPDLGGPFADRLATILAARG